MPEDVGAHAFGVGDHDEGRVDVDCSGALWGRVSLVHKSRLLKRAYQGDGCLIQYLGAHLVDQIRIAR